MCNSYHNTYVRYKLGQSGKEVGRAKESIKILAEK